MTNTIEEMNKALVLEAFDTLFNKREYTAAERYWSPNYIQGSRGATGLGVERVILSLPFGDDELLDCVETDRAKPDRVERRRGDECLPDTRNVQGTAAEGGGGGL